MRGTSNCEGDVSEDSLILEVLVPVSFSKSFFHGRGVCGLSFALCATETRFLFGEVFKQ
jgi:hypothetical protein